MADDGGDTFVPELHRAATSRDVGAIMGCLAGGEDVDVQDQARRTALYLAAERGFADVV
jgi:hypothetical protein